MTYKFSFDDNAHGHLVYTVSKHMCVTPSIALSMLLDDNDLVFYAISHSYLTLGIDIWGHGDYELPFPFNPLPDTEVIICASRDRQLKLLNLKRAADGNIYYGVLLLFLCKAERLGYHI